MKFHRSLYLHYSFCLTILCFYSFTVSSQDLEPRAYANVPKGTNVVAIVYGFANGNVLTDPSKPIEGAKVSSHNIGMGYVRTFALANKLARLQFTAPFIFLAGQGKLNGRDTSIARNGFGDARIRFGINLFGSPALSPREFTKFQQKTIVGFSLVASVPIGLYYKEKLINLGSNRWALKPEVGISRRFKRFYGEAYAGVWFFTDNREYLVDKTQEQDPVVSLQGHIAYYFKNQMWIGLNGNWFNGGETFVDNTPTGDLKDNWRIGAIWSVPLARQHSMKLQFHVGAFTNTGYDYNVVTLGYNYLFFSKK